MILRCILEIILSSFQLMITGFISVNKISISQESDQREQNKYCERIKQLAKRGVKRKSFSESQYERALLTRNIDHMVGAPTLKTVDDDKADYN